MGISGSAESGRVDASDQRVTAGMGTEGHPALKVLGEVGSRIYRDGEASEVQYGDAGA